MKRLTLLLFALLLGVEGFGQRLVWEKRIGLDYNDALNDVVSLDSGRTFIAAGYTGKGGFLSPSGTYYLQSILLCFTARGDTLWTQPLGIVATSIRICRDRLNGGAVVVLKSDTGQGSGPSGTATLWTIGLDRFGNEQYRTRLDSGDQATIEKAISLSDGSILVIGAVPNFQPTPHYDMYVARVDPQTGILYFFKRYSDHPYTLGNHIEETPRRTYLASGTAGSRIWAVEIDSNGIEIRRGTFYTTPSRIVFNETACVKQAPGGNYVVSGTTQGSGNNYPFYFGLHAGWGQNTRIWGGEKEVEIIPPAVNDDGTIVFYQGTRTELFLNKIDVDSLPVWQLPIHNRLAPGTFPQALYCNSDSSAILVGYTNDNTTSSRKDFFFSRITGVGVPFNPGPVAARPRMAMPTIKPYPNPCTTTFHFGGLTQPTRLELYGLDGKQHIAQNLKPGEEVDVRFLGPGLYVWQLGGQRGRLVRL